MSLTSFSMAYQMPPVELLPPLVELIAGRTSPYRDLANGEKVFVVVHVNPVNTSPVTVSLLQAQNVSGLNAKALNAVPVFTNLNTGSGDALTAGALASSVTFAGVANPQLAVFEILPIAGLDVANGFQFLAVSTASATAGNLTEAMLHVAGSYQRPAASTYS